MADTFPNTRTALAEFDEFNAGFDAKMNAILDDESEDPNARVLALFDELDKKAAAVGHAFGLDTADRNALDTCEACIRPGPWLRNLLVQEAP